MNARTSLTPFIAQAVGINNGWHYEVKELCTKEYVRNVTKTACRPSLNQLPIKSIARSVFGRI